MQGHLETSEDTMQGMLNYCPFSIRNNELLRSHSRQSSEAGRPAVAREPSSTLGIISSGQQACTPTCRKGTVLLNTGKEVVP